MSSSTKPLFVSSRQLKWVVTLMRERSFVWHTTPKGGGISHLFVEVYSKEITKIGEQICSLYSPTWSHFCSFTFHDVADLLPFFQHKSKLIKYPQKIASLCQDVCQLPRMPHFVTWSQEILPGESVLFPRPGQIWNLKCLMMGCQSSFCGSLPQRNHNNRGRYSLYNPSWSHFCSFTFMMLQTSYLFSTQK